MRELWARRIVLFTAIIVILLAIVFASIQNPVDSINTQNKSNQPPFAKRTQSIDFDPQYIELGRKIYMQQNCSFCHSIAGQGNPQNPLDGVGIKRSVNDLRQFIIGSESVQGLLPENVKKFKQRYKKLAEDEIDALIVYLQSLRL